MSDFVLDAATWEASDERTFRSTLSERWANGPGAYGGIVAASMLRQMIRVLDDDSHHPRTLNVHMSSPLRFEPAEMRVRVERQGILVSHLTARIEQDGETTAVASSTFAGTDSLEYLALECPDLPEFDRDDIVSDTPLLPRFSREFFEYQYALGEFPMSGADTPESGGWLRPEEPAGDGPLLASCLLDAWPPSVFSTFETFRRTMTVDLRYQFWSANPAGDATDEPFVFHARSDVVSEGYAEEDAVLWSRDEDLVARAKQLYAILD